MQEPDAVFADDDLAAVYDQFEGERDDLDAYLAIADEFGAERVLDIGCGTGEFALRLSACPSKRAWEGWTPDATFQRGTAPDGSTLDTWTQVVAVSEPLVTFDSTYRFADGSMKVSTSTLRFRTRSEVERSLESVGFTVLDVRDAPDRPGREFVFVAER